MKHLTEWQKLTVMENTRLLGDERRRIRELQEQLEAATESAKQSDVTSETS